MNLKGLVGSGDRIFLFTSPFLVIGLVLNSLYPPLFSVGGPPIALKVLGIVILIAGVTIWVWSVVLILTKVPKHELITSGPYALVKHPLYTSVALLVIPAVGLVLDTWLGILIGVVLYTASRIFAPTEERSLQKTFGREWDEYSKDVKLAWL